MKRRFLSILLVLCMVCTMLPLQALATFDDVDGHWGQAAIERLSAKEIVKGSLGKFRPDDKITRAEVATIVNNLMNYQISAENTFTDLPAGAWYTKNLLKASGAGVFSGTGDGKINPETDMTRQEFFVILARVLNLPDSSGRGTFSDRAEIADWALPKVNALAAAGFLNGTADGNGGYRVEPLRTITRAEVAAMIDRAFPGIYRSASTYTEAVNGNAVVSEPGVTLSGMTVSGSLYIAPGVGNGETILTNVKVPGTTFIQGGGQNSVYLMEQCELGDILVGKNGNDPIAVKVRDNSKVGTLTVQSATAPVTILVEGEGTVDTINADNAGTEITGKGKVGTVHVTADHVTVDTPDTKVIVSRGVTGTIVGGKTVVGGKTITTTATGKHPGIDRDDDPISPERPEGTYAVAFVTNGGAEIETKYVTIGQKLDPVPQAKKADAIFEGWYTGAELIDGNKFYASEVLTGDITLYAKYRPMAKNQQQKVDSFAVTDVGTGYTVTILAPGLNAEQVKNAITVTNIGAGGTPALLVAEIGSDTFRISAEGGFRAGSAITLNLGDGLTFDGMAAEIRNASFTVKKDEVNDIVFNENLKEVQIGTAGITAIVEPVLDDPNTVGNEAQNGTFTAPDSTIGGVELKPGALITLFDETRPEDRVSGDYSEDRIIYVKVVDADTDDDPSNGCQVEYKTPDTAAVIALPEVLPLAVSDLVSHDTSNRTFSIVTRELEGYWTDYDHLNLSNATTLDENDTVVLMGVNLDPMAEVTEASVVYGRVTSVTTSGENTVVTYAETDPEAIMAQTQDYYTEQDADYDAIAAKANKANLPAQIEKQALESGFVEEAVAYLTETAVQTEGFQTAAAAHGYGPGIELEQPGFPEGWTPGIHIPPIVTQGWDIQARISTNGDHFGEGGLMCQLLVEGDVEIPLSTDLMGDKLVIHMKASFEQELKVVVNVDGGIEWSWAAFIPYASDFYMNSNVDVFDYTDIRIQAKVSTVGGGIDLGGLADIDISQEIKDLLGMSDEDAEKETGAQHLFDMYADMLENETDYVTIVEQQIFDLNFPIMGLLKVGIKADFVIKANVNLVLGSNMLYSSGNRYNFWFKLFSGQSGTSTTQLADKEMKFQFYVMGMIGLRVGVNMEIYVAFILPKDTKGGTFEVAGTGVAIETGAYVELYGYFVYSVASLNDVVSSEMSGALYVDFGIYLEISFFARVADGIAAYQPMLYDEKWSLITAGERINVYDFSYEQATSDEKYIIKNYTTDYLPDAYWSMNGMDLMEGNLVSVVFPRDRFVYSLSNPAFKFDQASGQITVTVPKNTRYMECDMTVTWAGGKLAFSTGELTRTLHLVWTNLADEEMSLRHNINVVANGKVIWSKVVGEGEQYELPNAAELKKLLDFGTYMKDGDDLKYTAASKLEYKNQNSGEYFGADSQKNPDGTADTSKLLTADRDLIYTVNVELETYTLHIVDVQDENGSAAPLELKAKFGEHFDLTGLYASGNRSGVGDRPYTVYVTTECQPVVAPADTQQPAKEGKAIDAVIDAAFAKQLLDGTYIYTAKYNNNFVTATFKFVDSRGKLMVAKDQDGKTPAVMDVKVEKDTRTDFDYYNYVTDQAYKISNDTITYMPKRFNKELTKLTADETYTVTCVMVLPNSEEHSISCYTIPDDTEAGVISLDRYYASHVTLPNPEQEGYTFGGWYKDAEYGEAFTDKNMSNEAFGLYAKWTANTYKVTFDANAVGSVVSATPEGRTVTFGGRYGTLPEIRRSGYKLLGWTTERDGEHTVGDVNTAGDHVLYAKWQQKKLIAADYLVQDKISAAYDKQTHPFELIWNRPAPVNPVDPAAEGEEGATPPVAPVPPIALADFTVQYKGKNPVYSANRWFSFEKLDAEGNVVTSGPVDCENYDVMLYRPEDDTYQMYKQVVIDGVKITKATRTNVAMVAPTEVADKTYQNVTVAPAAFTGEDVRDGVPMYRMELWGTAFGDNTVKQLGKTEWGTSLTVPYASMDPNVISFDAKPRIYAMLSGGRNYEDWTVADPTNAASYLGLENNTQPDASTLGSFTAHIEVKTGGHVGNNDTTDSPVYWSLRGYEDTSVYSKQLSTDGHNDFWYNTLDRYDVGAPINPWLLNGEFRMELGGKDGWRYTSLEMTYNDSVHGDIKKVCDSSEVPYTLGDYEHKNYKFAEPDTFKRTFTSAGQFADWGGEYKLDKNSAGTIAYTFDGQLTDQYGTYNVYTHSDAPSIKVGTTDRNGAFVDTPYQDVITYSNYGLSIDQAKLYQKMAAAELDTVTFTVKLDVPASSCANADSEMFIKTITFTV